LNKLPLSILAVTMAVLLGVSAPAAADATQGRTTYIVMPAEGASAEVRAAISALGEYPEEQFLLIDNLIVVDLLAEDAKRLAQNPAVVFVEADSPISTSVTQSPTPSWGQDRIDGNFDNSFSYPGSAGEDVRVYVIDTGVAGDHPDLVGRVTTGFDVIGSNQANTDCHYHGTHVAGTIAGSMFGLAKKATIVPLRVLGCTGSGSTLGVIRAVNWTLANHPSGTPGVANLSLGGPRNLSFNAAIASLVDRGIATVVAAGNSYSDACNFSPASTPEAITVGATDRFDNRASFSNFGDCVDVFAPGVSIPSANAKNYSSPVSLSGTSMASPHVAGVAALILGVNPGASAEQVESLIYSMSQPGVVKNARTERGNRMAVSPGQNFSPLPNLAGAPTGLAVKSSGRGFVEFSWNAVTGAKGYQVEYRKASQNNFSSADVAGTSFSVSDLSGGEVAYLRVRATTESGNTRFTSIVSGKSAVVPPTQARNLLIEATSKNAMVLSWLPPTSIGGAANVQYQVQMKTTGNWQSIQTGPQSRLSVSDLRVPHFFRVVAFNEAGSSEPTPEVTFDPSRVFVVSELRATVVDRTVNLAWSSDATEATQFEVRVIQTNTSQLIRSLVVTGTTARVEGLLRFTNYRVSVTPLSELRGVSSSQDFATAATAPDSPRALSTAKATSGHILRFAAPLDDGGSPITGYRLEQFVDSTWKQLQTNATPEVTVADPAKGQSAVYRLVAINAVGESVPSASLTISTPAQVSSAPQSLTIEVAQDGRVRLSWLAPADDGGAAVLQYRIEVLRSETWSLVTALTNTSVSLAPIAKGTSLSYRVVAVNRAGSSAPSNVVTASRAKTVPGNIDTLTSTIRGEVIAFSWRLVSDNGGSPITGYQLQVKTSGAWISAAEPTTLTSIEIPVGTSGEVRTYRVVAINELGASQGGNERTVTMPFKAASSPQGFTSELESTRIKFSWQAPLTTGGSDIRSYLISSSSDGVTYRPLLSVPANQLLAYVTNPVRGISISYRIQAVTAGFGNGEASKALNVVMPAIAPSDPRTLTSRVQLGSGIVLNWMAPSSDGGSPVTGYRVEVQTGTTWTSLGETRDLTFSAPLGSAGESVVHRVLALNSAGASAGSIRVSTRMGVAPASAPRQISATLSSGRLQVSWLAPETMGGVLSYYEIQTVNGTGFNPFATTRSTSFIATPPAAGQSISYRIAAYTNAGLGAWSETFTYQSPRIAPAAPSAVYIRSVGIKNTVSWRVSGVSDGGSALQNAVLYREVSGNWVRVAQATASSEVMEFDNAEFGQTHRYVLRFTNAIGESGNSAIQTLRHAVIPTSPARDVRITPEGSRLRLSWSGPEFNGGAQPSSVDIESSVDGQTWRRASSMAYAESALVNAPAKGTSIRYRVILRNPAGNSMPSNVVTYETPRTAPSENFSVSSYRSGSNAAFRVTAPSDFGGYSSLSLRIELQGTLAWQSSEEFVLIRSGSSTIHLLPLPTSRGTHMYRVVLVNPSGEVEKSVSFRY